MFGSLVRWLVEDLKLNFPWTQTLLRTFQTLTVSVNVDIYDQLLDECC